MEHQGEVINLNYEGCGITRLDNKVVFINKTIPHDIVNYKITHEYKNYAIGEVISYEKENNHNLEYNCCYYQRCGGCQIARLNYQEQLEFKKEKVEDLFKRYLGINKKLKIIANDTRLGYRNKIVMQVKDGKIGFYEENTHNLIEVDKCLLVDFKVNEIIKMLKDIDLTNVNKIMIRSTSLDIMIVFYGKIIENQVVSIFKDKVSSIINFDSEYKVIYGKDKIREEINNLYFEISPDSFFQINKNQMIKLYDKILEYVDVNKSQKVLDLYSGIGTISLYLAKFCKEVIGVEINKYAVEDAKYNAKINNITNVRFINKNANGIRFSDVDTIVVDPPRGGLDNKTKNILLESRVKRIVYVSCNPLTLVRDLKALGSKYVIKDITLVDMFSYSYHVESVVKLELK